VGGRTRPPSGEPRRGGPIAAGACRGRVGLHQPEPGAKPPPRRARAGPYSARTGGSDNRSYVARRGTPSRSGGGTPLPDAT